MSNNKIEIGHITNKTLKRSNTLGINNESGFGLRFISSKQLLFKDIKETEKPKKIYDPRLYDKEKYELVDFGEKSYQKLTDSISQMNGVMWLGTLSPSKIENLYENYIKILDSINTRKKLLKEKFDIDQATQEKKLNETELKARKQLLNIFLKGKKAYETIKDNFRYITSGAAQNQLEDLGDDDEGPQEDDEQFNHDMHVLIDYYINDDFELINSILKGKNIPGFYGVNVEKPIVKEEEFDPKCLEDITN
jgi:3-phosphoglycerate kinase